MKIYKGFEKEIKKAQSMSQDDIWNKIICPAYEENLIELGNFSLDSIKVNPKSIVIINRMQNGHDIKICI